MINFVDYTLKRRSTIKDFRSGRISRWEACDAHPEITRIARNCGEETDSACPICGKFNLRNLNFVYGDDLGYESGRIFPIDVVFNGLLDRFDSFICYVVEVCLDCSWNHLVRSYHIKEEDNRERKARQI